MKFKALIFDLDGTAFPIGRKSTPSDKVVQAVKKAKQLVSVSVATARRLSSLENIFKILELESPSIIMGGTVIINPASKKILWQKFLDQSIVSKISGIAKKYPGELIMGDGPIYDRQKNFSINKCSVIYLRNPSREIAGKIIEELKQIAEIAFFEAVSWIPNWVDIHITNIEATKRQAVEKLIEFIGVKKEEIIVVGDSTNDLPLFESAGFKVAMGNAEEFLKEKADFIAPSIDEDGLSKVIEKFILSKNI